MARIYPFHAYRYAPQAGALADLLTQPYDKISPAMQAKYLAASPYNLVRVILGERRDSDSDSDNVYTRSAAFFQDWIAKGILARDPEPALYAYDQEFAVPDSGERMTRQGFIGLGAVEPYEANVVYRHERTLAGPKKDRRLVLDHTHAHFGQIFMLYPDPARTVDALLDEAKSGAPDAEVTDEYGAVHRIWRIADPARIARIQAAMADKKLLIADGHHRYETALAYHADHPEIPGAANVMMTFVNMNAPGLRILATHRVIPKLEGFSVATFAQAAGGKFRVLRLKDEAALKSAMAQPEPDTVRIGVVAADAAECLLLRRPRQTDEMDVPVLHGEILGGILAIPEEAVRHEFLHYVRGMDAAIAEVRQQGAAVAFLLDPTPIGDMARIAFGGGVMPQKSTDFYPKLLTGMAIYKIDE